MLLVNQRNSAAFLFVQELEKPTGPEIFRCSALSTDAAANSKVDIECHATFSLPSFVIVPRRKSTWCLESTATASANAFEQLRIRIAAEASCA